MPAGYRKERPYPGKCRKLGEAAEAHQIIVVKCRGCRRVVRFLAEDLVRLLDPERDVTEPPFPCSHCGSTAALHIDIISPSMEDTGLMEVRRPGPVVRRQSWRTMKLGDPYIPDRRPKRPYGGYHMSKSVEANLELINATKGWLLERVAELRAENDAIAGGLRLAFRREHAGSWEDCTAAIRQANEELILRMESLVVSIEEEADEIRDALGRR